MLGCVVFAVAATVGVIYDAASCCCVDYSTAKPTCSLVLEEFKQYLHDFLHIPMTCPMDPTELNSHAVILHNAMWVIGVETLEVEWVLHMFSFDICLLDSLDII